MKKKILGIALMAAVALTAGWNISQSDNEVELSDLALDNVEALVSGEQDMYFYNKLILYDLQSCKAIVNYCVANLA